MEAIDKENEDHLNNLFDADQEEINQELEEEKSKTVDVFKRAPLTTSRATDGILTTIKRMVLVSERTKIVMETVQMTDRVYFHHPLSERLRSNMFVFNVANRKLESF